MFFLESLCMLAALSSPELVNVVVQKQVIVLIKDLGDPKFGVRQSAHNRLVEMGKHPTTLRITYHLVNEARQNSKDPEVLIRAGRISDHLLSTYMEMTKNGKWIGAPLLEVIPAPTPAEEDPGTGENMP